MLNGLKVVLHHTRFPENIGMVARACANMGCHEICLVRPERWTIEKAIPLATPKGVPLLEKIVIYDDLADAVGEANLVIGTTARTGGWRKVPLSPEQAAMSCLTDSVGAGRIAIVFGPEDRGLDNVDTQLCNMLITIPTATEASSLNLAQAVLLILYEFNKVFKKNFTHIKSIADQAKLHNLVNADEFSRMMTSLKEMLCQIDYLHGNNSDYFMLIWKNLLSRSRLRRYEYDAIMGLCRQVKNICLK